VSRTGSLSEAIEAKQAIVANLEALLARARHELDTLTSANEIVEDGE